MDQAPNSSCGAEQELVGWLTLQHFVSCLPPCATSDMWAADMTYSAMKNVVLRGEAER